MICRKKTREPYSHRCCRTWWVRSPSQECKPPQVDRCKTSKVWCWKSQEFAGISTPKTLQTVLIKWNPRRTVLFCRNKNPVKIHSSWRFYFPTHFSPSFLGPKSASRCSLLVFAYAGFVGSQQVSNQSPILGDQKTICYRYWLMWFWGRYASASRTKTVVQTSVGISGSVAEFFWACWVWRDLEPSLRYDIRWYDLIWSDMIWYTLASRNMFIYPPNKHGFFFDALRFRKDKRFGFWRGAHRWMRLVLRSCEGTSQ